MFFDQIQTACINDDDIPWVPFTPYSDKVFIKYFKLDPIRGETITLLKAPASGKMPMHQHTGTVIVYTLQGRWKYREHDWIASKGSVVYEVAGSSHTPQALPDEDNIITLNIVQGDLLFLNPRKQVVAMENWRTGWERYAAYCNSNGYSIRDLTSFG
ncbi:cupin [Caballeronia calidae]|uniref:Cupin n=1 Tax=Caballeronia calidae TaxID=1777139 RepID=A0A158EFU4_9BURK|nr:2,4'-dihydroxyacetophenone dioxygenase family protein [Caballeronia calidae]SAL05759.1 cupin [Caballeronia calidae]